MKYSITFSLIIATTGFVAAAYFYSENASNRSAIENYDAHVQQLLSQAEENSRERLQLNAELADLRSDLTSLRSQLTATTDQLAIAESQTDPNFQQLEVEIRERVEREYEEFQAEHRVSERVGLIQDLSKLDPVELSEVMAVHGQFGAFLQALDVDDARMEVVVDALSNVVASQNQARADILQAVQNEEIGRREMREVMNPETMFEELAYSLTEDELNLLQQVREEQSDQAAFGTFSMRAGNTLSVNPGLIQQGRGVSPAQPISPRQ